MNKDMINYLLAAPDSQLDTQIKPYIKKWSDTPTSLQILEVLDYCINGALASGFVITILQAMYDETCKIEGTTHEAVANQAVWRK